MTPQFVREYEDGLYHKSDASGAGNDCVMARSDQRAFRDSKDGTGRVLAVKRGTFRAFIAGLRDARDD